MVGCVETDEPEPRREPRVTGHEQQRQHQERSENSHHQEPVEDLERAFDPTPEEQHGDAREKGADADEVDSAGVGRTG